MKKLSSSVLKDIILSILDERKAENVTVIDLQGKTDIADFMIIATGRSNKHVQSTAEFILQELKAVDSQYKIEGMAIGDWVLVDTFDVLLHIFNSEKRELYALEKLWQG
jgi:ribosome-associated protein